MHTTQMLKFDAVLIICWCKTNYFKSSLKQWLFLLFSSQVCESEIEAEVSARTIQTTHRLLWRSQDNALQTTEGARGLNPKDYKPHHS